MRSQSIAYIIQIDGTLDAGWSEWLGGWQIAPGPYRDGPTMLVRATVPDQAALRGILNRLWDLNLSIISVTRVEH